MPPRVRLLEASANGFWLYRETKSCGGFGGNPPIPPAFATCPAFPRAPPRLDRRQRSRLVRHMSGLRPAPPDLTDVDHWMVLVLQVRSNLHVCLQSSCQEWIAHVFMQPLRPKSPAAVHHRTVGGASPTPPHGPSARAFACPKPHSLLACHPYTCTHKTKQSRISSEFIGQSTHTHPR